MLPADDDDDCGEDEYDGDASPDDRRMNTMKRRIPIAEIRIPAPFLSKTPREEKIAAKAEGYAAKRRFEPLPTVDQDLNLIDGYASYMAAKRLGHAELYCEVQQDPMATVVTARHPGCDKDYRWVLPRRASNPGYITVGTDIAVPTKYGTRRVTVTAIETMPAVESKTLKTALGKWHVKTPEELASERAAK